MDSKKMVKLSNRIGFIAVLALIYWVIIFITTNVFELSIFGRTVSDTFTMSIIGILVLMFGALIINIMFNLSRIADKNNNDNEKINKKMGKGMIIFIISLPVIIISLFLGNYLSEKKVEKEFKHSAEEIIGSYESELDKIIDYTFEKDWINNSINLFSLMTRLNHNIYNISIILEDEINGNPVYLMFGSARNIIKTEAISKKIDFVMRNNLDERKYLEKVFKENYNEKHFISHTRAYNLFIPYEKNGNRVVLFFSNRRDFGLYK